MSSTPAAAGGARSNARAAATVIGTYLTTVIPLARLELRAWERRATRIPAPDLRRHALATLATEHMNAEGAALFAVLAPPRRRRPLVKALVAYQTLYDYLDTLGEQPVDSPAANSRQLHRALTDALSVNEPTSSWYRHHPSNEHGYLSGLVETCRAGLAGLPSLARVRPAALASARRAIAVQTLNHQPAPQRAVGLRDWAQEALRADPWLTWWEHAAAGCSTLDLHALLALASASPIAVGPAEVRRTVSYGTALCGLNTMLESLVDLPADRRSGDHSYISYYRSPDEAALRLRALAALTLERATQIRRADHQLAIAQAMASLYLARPEVRSPEARPVRTAVLATLPAPLPRMIATQRRARGLRRRRAYLIES